MTAGDDNVVAMEPGVADRLSRRFVRHAAGLGRVRGDLAAVVDLLDAGAGEFVDAMTDASATFGASWEEAAARAELSAALVGMSVEQFASDLAEVDARAAQD